MKTKKRTFVVGLTGGFGSGKSSALREFSAAGADTMSLDAIAHKLSRKGGPCHRGVVRAFGRGVLAKNGELDRKALGDVVFRDARKRRRLERATHPAILREMRRRIRASRKRLVVADVPLLFERKLEDEFDATIVVSASRRRQIDRVRRRDGLKPAAIRRRLAAQMPLSRKKILADVVILNEGSLKQLRSRVNEYTRAFGLINAR